MSEAATAARPVGIIAKTARRLAVALTIAIAVWLLLLTHRRTSPSSMLFRLIILALSATMALALFEVWPRLIACTSVPTDSNSFCSSSLNSIMDASKHIG